MTWDPVELVYVPLKVISIYWPIAPTLLKLNETALTVWMLIPPVSGDSIENYEVV